MAKALDRLSTTTDDDPQHELEKFLAYAGIDWPTLYAGSLEVGLEGTPGSYKALLYTIHKVSYGTAQISRSPDEPVVVPDWRDAGEFGAAVLRAFGTATTEITS